MKDDLMREIELPEGVTAVVEGSVLTVKGKEGEVKRNFTHPRVKMITAGNKVTLNASKATKREKTIIGSFESHIKNMVAGVQNKFLYKLKVCSGHFPMNVAVAGKEMVVKNFLGESVPRKVDIPEDVDVKVNGDIVEIKSVNKELAGVAASRIEHLCKIKGRDIRIFMDGLWLTHKGGKDI
jgi:large subunit ribosomal protein L6